VSPGREVRAGARGAGRLAGRLRPEGPALVLNMPSDTSLLGLVREVTKRAAADAGFDPGTAAQIALAVDEATTNVIEHAYRGAADRDVELRFDARDDAFRVEIVDSGEMVDPRAMPRVERVDLDRYARERRTGGLGVHLMEKIMDSVTFRRSRRKNVCCLVKKKVGARAG